MRRHPRISDLELPDRPSPLYDLSWLEHSFLERPENLPPGWSVRPLGSEGEYALTVQGQKEPLRITTRRGFYEDHPDSTELWSPGSPAFPWGDST